MVRIRPVTQVDLPAVRAQLVATWHATYDTIYGAETVVDITGRWHSLEALGRQVDAPDGVLLLAEAADGQVLASSYAVRQAGGIVHLARLYVAPHAQGRGFGQALLDATFAALPGATRHRLEVEPRNAGAIAFYRRNGFTAAGRTSDCGGSSGVPGLIMERAAPRGAASPSG